MALSEQFEEFDGVFDYSHGTTNTNASFGHSREHGQTHRSTIQGQAVAFADAITSSLTKAELADLLFEQVGLNKREAKDLVDTFFAEINSALEHGESVKLTGFGNFQLRDKASRPGRNPKTGVAVQIPARRVVTFHASQKLKDMVDDSAVPGLPERVDVNDRG